MHILTFSRTRSWSKISSMNARKVSSHTEVGDANGDDDATVTSDADDDDNLEGDMIWISSSSSL